MNREMPAVDRRMNAARISKNFLPPPQGLPFNEEREPERQLMERLTMELDEATMDALRDMADKKGLDAAAIAGMLMREFLTEGRSA